MPHTPRWAYLLQPFSRPWVLLAVTAAIGLAFLRTVSVNAVQQTELTIDPTRQRNPVSPLLFGDSTDSSFAYVPGLSGVLAASPVPALRVVAPAHAGARMLLRVKDGIPTILAQDNTPYVAGKTSHVKVSAFGSRLAVQVDGKTVLSATDTTFSSGTYGVMTSFLDSAAFDTVRVTDSVGRVQHREDFTHGLPSVWGNGGIPSFFNEGQWNVRNGQLHHDGLQEFSFRTTPQAYRSASVSADITPEPASASSAGFIGLVARQQDPLNGYRFVWRGAEQQPFASNRPWNVRDISGTLQTVQELHAEPIVTVNFRGTEKEAVDLVRDLNIRQKRGVRFFEMGNEPYAYGDGAITPEAYAQRFRSFARAMRRVDPKIQFGLPLLVSHSNWDAKIAPLLAKEADFAVIHPYLFNVSPDETREQLLAGPTGFAEAFESDYGSDGMIAQVRRIWARGDATRAMTIPVFATEFNTGSDRYGSTLLYALSLTDFYGRLAQQGVRVGLFHTLNAGRNHWTSFTPDLRPRPAELARRLAAETLRGVLVETSLEGSSVFSSTARPQIPVLRDVPELHSYAAYDASTAKLRVLVVNDSRSAQSVRLRLPNVTVDKRIGVVTLSGNGELSDNEQTSTVRLVRTSRNNGSSRFTYSFPASSVTALTLSVVRLSAPSVPSQPSPSLRDARTVLTVASGGQQSPAVALLDTEGRTVSRFPLPDASSSGQDVTVGDVDGDGVDEIVVADGPGRSARVRVFAQDGRLRGTFFPFGEAFHGGLHVDAGQADTDTQDELVLSLADGGDASVVVYDVKDVARPVRQASWTAFVPSVHGADVAFADTDGNGIDEVVAAAGVGAAPFVRAFRSDGVPLPFSFMAFVAAYHGGLSVAGGDIDGDGVDEIVVAQRTQEAWTKVVRMSPGLPLVGEWRAFDALPSGADVTIDEGRRRVITVSASGAPHLRAFTPDGRFLGPSTFPFAPARHGGMNVSAF